MIWLDMDGVFFDFDKHYEALFGYKPTRECVDWDLVRSVPDFYLSMPLTHYARTLFAQVMSVCALYGAPNPKFLTGIPATVDAADNHKRGAAERHFPGTEVVCCRSRDKWLFCRPGDILIDDYTKYRVDWQAAGGVFIHHTSLDGTIAQLGESQWQLRRPVSSPPGSLSPARADT